jgi:alpha-tubulin suppressor-like RCC1 family protein
MKKLGSWIFFGAIVLVLGVFGNTATVNAEIYTLSISTDGTGGGTVLSFPSGISCGADCSESLESGTLVSLWPMPDPGSHFAGWSGGWCSNMGQCVVSINGDTTVTATFNSHSSSSNALDGLHISANYMHNHALKSNGTLWAWGWNFYYQLGDGTLNIRNSPIRIGTDTDWVSVSNGTWHGFARKSDGSLWGWGSNISGEVGDGTFYNYKPNPVKIGTDTDWVGVFPGGDYTIALKSNGTLWAWGGNRFGSLGLGDTIDRHSPVQLGSDTDWVSVSEGGYHTLALKSDGTLWAWGYNASRQLGTDSTDVCYSHSPVACSMTPLQVGSDTDWVSVSTGPSHSYALKSDGTLWAWGISGYIIPTQIGTDTDWILVSAGNAHNLFQKSDGGLWVSGTYYVGNYGECPINPPALSPIPIHSGINWLFASAGGFHDLAMKSDNTLWAWGEGMYGQIGSVPRSCDPVQILFPSSPPTANAGPDQSVDCGGPNGSSVTLDGSQSSDPEGDVLSYSWSGPFGTATGVSPTVTVPLGTHTITLTVDDGMNGPVTDTVEITVSDTIPPSTSAMLDGTMGQNDWFVSDVIVTLIATDNCSGVKEIHYAIDGVEQPVVLDSTAVFILAEDGAHTLTYWAVDNALNTEQAGVLPVNIDATAPEITITGISQGIKYPACTPPTPEHTATDATSGLSTSSATHTGGNANGVGEYSYEVTASDIAGNTAVETVTYKVVYTFEGFLIPVSKGKSFNLGSTIPVKFRLNDGCGNPVSVATATLSLQLLVGGEPTSNPIPDSGNTFLYVPEENHYIYNLSSDILSVGTWQATVTLDDTEAHTINIGIK